MGKKQEPALSPGKAAVAFRKSSTMPSVREMNSSSCGASSQEKQVHEDDRLYLTCFRFCTSGNVYNAEVFDDEELIQIQMTCAAVPSPIFRIFNFRSTADRRPPTADRRQPTADRRRPIADRRQPTDDRRPPTADTLPPHSSSSFLLPTPFHWNPTVSSVVRLRGLCLVI